MALMTDGNDPWWRGAVIYQVYPRSFLDTNGDGIGDLPGIAAKLDYIRRLGVDAIWISPFYRSPQRDFGYDVADHCDVDPIFGSLADFDRLLEAAHACGLKVVVDQVYSHTSDRHDWFAESRSSRDNPKADWYVWADAKADGSPPNNWLSVFGGPAWTWDARRRQYYLHNYLASQPDLNLHHPDVQSAILDVARFWLDRGIDGMRLDAINYGMHDPRLTDNPPAAPEHRGDSRPWLMQAKRYNTNHPGMPAFLERVSALAREYGEILTVAEVGGDDSLSVLREYTRGASRLATGYGFDFLYARAASAAGIRAALGGWPNDAHEGWPSWAFSNHDAPRVASRWDLGKDTARRARLFGLLLMALRGNAFVYQGEELGLPQADVPYERLRDPEAIAHWPESLGRDGARTPMPWTRASPHAGFTGAEPWLPVDAAHLGLAVDAQDADPASTLNFFRELIALRARTRALRHGDIAFIDAPQPVLAFRRTAGDECFTAAFNLSESACDWSPDNAGSLRVVSGVGVDGPDVPAALDGCTAYLAAES